VAAAEYHMFLNGRSETLKALERYPEALDAIDKALDQAPQSAEYLVQRGSLLMRLGRFEEGASAYQLAQRLEQTSVTVTSAVKYGVSLLIRAGYDRSQAGSQRLARAGAVQKLEESSMADPADFDTVKKLDDELVKTREFPKIIEHWNRYLAVKPNDPRAYYERGGALYHTSQAARAIEDMDRACKGGISDACRAAQVMRSRMK
jgi:tetratricopeptide (TPR) repeat protein